MRCLQLSTVLLLIPMLSLAGCTRDLKSTSTSEGQEQADQDAIRHVFEQFDSTATAGQEDEWMSLLTDDVLWMVPEQSSLVGKQAVHGRVAPFFADLKMRHVTILDEVRVAGSLAFVRGTYNFEVTPKAGGATTDEVGKFVYILERQPGNTWKIARAIWNTNRKMS